MSPLLLIFFFLVTTTTTTSAQPTTSDGGSGLSMGQIVFIFCIVLAVSILLLIYAKGIKFTNPNDPNPSPSPSPTEDPRSSSGIDKLVVESIPFFRFSSLKGSRNGLECAVCLSKFQDVEMVRLLPSCKHAFHVDCLDTWLESHATCPLCRYKIDPEDGNLFKYSDSLKCLFQSRNGDDEGGSVGGASLRFGSKKFDNEEERGEDSMV